MKTKTKQKIVTRFLNEGADGMIYVSKRPMSQKFYMTPQILKCVQTKRTKITNNGVYVGAICITLRSVWCRTSLCMMCVLLVIQAADDLAGNFDLRRNVMLSVGDAGERQFQTAVQHDDLRFLQPEKRVGRNAGHENQRTRHALRQGRF